MKIINKCLSSREFRGYLKRKNITRAMDKIVLHHTWDTREQWERGETSVAYYKNLYEKKGWTSGPHIFIAPEGIRLFTDINTEGTHANKGNQGSVGIEIVGRYDDGVPNGGILQNLIAVLRTVMDKFNLGFSDIHFHREYNLEKSCPGRAITQKWILEIIRE